MRTAAPQIESSRPRAGLTRGEKLSLAAVLSATLLTFASTFTFGWVYDDPPQIPQNPDLQWGRLGYLLSHHLWASASGTEARFYRPVLSVWFLIDKSLFGLNPGWFHVTAVLAHLAATALAFLIARKLLKDSAAALLAAGIFALHPLQVESVAWISAVNDPLAATLCFASFLASRRARTLQPRAGLWWSLSGIWFLLALFTKEVSVVLPAIVLVDLWVESRGNDSYRRAVGIVLSLYGVGSVAWFAARTLVLGDAAASHSSLGWDTTLLSIPKVVLFNLSRILAPVGLSPHYDSRLVESAGAQFLLPLGLLVVLAALAIAAAKHRPELWVAYAWLFLPMLPTLNLRWMNQGDFVHDRYLYMSMFGAALLAARAYETCKRKWPEAAVSRILPAVLLVAMGFASAIQSQYWANDMSLFSRVVKIAPTNEWALLNYGSALSARGKHGEAAEYFVRSYQQKPSWQAAEFAAISYRQSEAPAQAEHWYEVALQENRTLATAWFGLGQIRLQQHRPEEAIVHFRKALEIQPDAQGYHYALGMALEQVSRLADALAEYQTELERHPDQRGAQKAIDRVQDALRSRR